MDPSFDAEPQETLTAPSLAAKEQTHSQQTPKKR